MGTPDDAPKDAPDRAALDALGDRIEAAKRRTETRPRRSSAAQKYAGASLAWRMVSELVSGPLIGFAAGYGLDALFGTRPVLMIVVGLLGVAAGAKVAYETARRYSEQSGGGA